MGNTRIQEMSRAQALREIAELKDDFALAKRLSGNGEFKVTWGAFDELEKFHEHPNYHVRVAAWKARGAPMPTLGTHEETLNGAVKLALELQPNQTARYFAQQDAELQETLAGFEDAQKLCDSSEEGQRLYASWEQDKKRAKEFSDAMKQQFCVSLLARISGQGMVV